MIGRLGGRKSCATRAYVRPPSTFFFNLLENFGLAGEVRGETRWRQSVASLLM